MKALIVSSGDIRNSNIIKTLCKDVDLIACADGGANLVIKADCIPDIVIGDLDSIEKDTLNKLKKSEVKFIKFPTKKDKTDTELAIEYIIERGFNEIVLVGVTGTRLDHTLANIFLLYSLLQKGVKATIIDDHNEIFITKDELVVYKDDKKYVSIIPFNGDLLGVTLKGFEYELKDRNIKFSSTLGISNTLVSDAGIIKVEDGVCLVIKSID
ncbi:thiamine diphosphokinase [Caloranaerobacter azorensis]|uniref:Thiamine diphosphokinase n=3 Tax=Caloranaerobacter azorensis TaxID=116090 RepID=A0A1M5RR13_9FIRM|nr:thiamine diphosphokinase [Caloranaerobacter azorensis]KGG81124.1 thiamine pyrophosphokinase [Caloranaerobacter azorensis H53214]QIB26249.1 thiamine diphosphokinase [Caloranaerobacter azorensis]SHH28639.1 thiamine pyrophosphokinase [Caloranaerobacter azorensis DSM 13643]